MPTRPVTALLPSALGLGLLLAAAPVGAGENIDARAQGVISAALGQGDGRYWAKRTDHGFVTENDRLGVRVDHGPEGPTVRSGENALAVRFAWLGRGKDLAEVPAVRPRAGENRVEYPRDGVVEWYANGPLGLQQGFRLERPPDEGSPQGPLVLVVEMAGTLVPRLEEDGLAIVAPDGRTLLHAAGLAGVDARGKGLPTALFLEGGLLRVEVDDGGAVYPILLDPVFKAARLAASDGQGGDLFGFTVAVQGDTIVVGAPQDDVDPNVDQGAAYVFVRPAGGWRVGTQAAKLLASDGAANDQFGISVAVSGDDVFVGAWNDDNAGLGGPGSVYVFTKPAAGWSGVVNQTAKLLASDRQDGDALGASVAASGGVVVAGAPFDDSPFNAQGSAYVFVRPAGGWVNATQDAKLTASDPATSDRLGSAVAISGDTIVLGAPLDNGATTDEGSAYVYQSATWAGALFETARLTSSDAQPNASFGFSVAVQGDTVVVGAVLQMVNTLTRGAAYVFTRPAAGWTTTSAFTARLSVAEGNTTDRLGESVAIVGDTIVAGARFGPGPNSLDQGAAYAFVKPAGGWATTNQHREKFVAADGAASDSFGAAVARSGSTTVVGAFGHDLGNGALRGQVYVFQP